MILLKLMRFSEFRKLTKMLALLPEVSTADCAGDRLTARKNKNRGDDEK